MDYLRKNRVLVVIIAILLLVNVGTISFLLFFRGAGDRFGGRKGRGAVVAFIEKELHLSDAQKEQFARLREEHFRKAEALRREQHELRKSMLELLREDKGDEEEMSRIAAAMGQKETELAVSTFEHFRALRSLCSPEQQGEFDAILQDVLKMTRPSKGDTDRAVVPRESFPDTK